MFDFPIVRSWLKPKWSFFFCVLTFCCLACLYWLGQPEITSGDLAGAVHEFLQDEQGNHPRHPQILIAGSSLSGAGFHIEELEKRLNMPAAKISLGEGTPKDMLDILECYPEETRHVHTIFLELAPQILTVEQYPMRKQFFDNIRGVTNTGTLIGFLRRSSMQNFIELYSKPFRRFVNRMRKQTRSDQPTVRAFEEHWHAPTVPERVERVRIGLRQRAEQARKNRTHSIPEHLPLMVGLKSQDGKVPYKESQIEALYQFLDLCRSRKIFVAMCITPEWYGQLNFTQEDLDNPTEDPYLSLLQEVNRRHDCSVIICRDFEEITDEGTDEDYLFDYGHMTLKGAMVYTNWLVNRLLEDPKYAEFIRQ